MLHNSYSSLPLNLSTSFLKDDTAATLEESQPTFHQES